MIPSSPVDKKMKKKKELIMKIIVLIFNELRKFFREYEERKQESTIMVIACKCTQSYFLSCWLTE